MKHTNLSIMFVIITVSVFLIISQKIDTVVTVTKLQTQYNNAVDNAVADALSQVVDYDSIDATGIDFAMVTDRFLCYLAWNLGLEAESQHGRTISNYVPVIAFVVQDGLYLAYHKIWEGDEQGEGSNIGNDSKRNQEYEKSRYWNVGEWNTSMEVSEYIPFEQKKGLYQIRYSLTDYITIINTQTKQNVEGVYGDLVVWYSDILPSAREEFDTERRLVITNCLIEAMNTYIENHNSIARQFGLNYQFALPCIEMEEWYRTVDRVSMLVLFQGYPYGNDSLGYYNKMALGGARIRKGLY